MLAQHNPSNEGEEADIAQRVLVALASKTSIPGLPPARDIETGQARMASATFDGTGYSVTRYGHELRFHATNGPGAREDRMLIVELTICGVNRHRGGWITAVAVRPPGEYHERAAERARLLVAQTIEELGYQIDVRPQIDVRQRHNPAPDDFAARVTAGHIQKTTVSAKKAYTWATQFSPRDAEVTKLAMIAGEFAAYSGRPLDQWHANLARELAIPVIAAAFDSKFHETIANLETPDEELDDEPAENPARWPSSRVQSLLFDIDHWSVKAAKMWAREHGFKYGYVDTTAEYHHLRQFEPIRGRPCRTVVFKEDARGTIKARICSG